MKYNNFAQKSIKIEKDKVSFYIESKKQSKMKTIQVRELGCRVVEYESIRVKLFQKVSKVAPYVEIRLIIFFKKIMLSLKNPGSITLLMSRCKWVGNYTEKLLKDKTDRIVFTEGQNVDDLDRLRGLLKLRQMKINQHLQN